MQLSFKSSASHRKAPQTACDLRRGEAGVLDQVDLPDAEAQRLMELGFIPGHTVTTGCAAPTGDPVVLRVDGTEVAVRREIASRLRLRPTPLL
jgi:Fe2+ transport system protein FeoA